MKGILGKKVGMTQVFSERGEAIPVTVIEAGPCFVAQIKTVEQDGYAAVQLGFEETKPKRLTQPQLKHLQKSNLPALRHLRELRIADDELVSLEEGQKLTVDIFEEGACTTPGRVFKGKRMPGRMGGERVTTQGLQVVLVDPERNLLALRGAVPGSKNGLLLIREARKTQLRKKVRK